MGKVEDSYICSSRTMMRAYKKRPESFRFRVLEYVYGDLTDLRLCEQKWLDKIDDSELLLTPNVEAGTVRYYNVKKFSAGGNGKGTNKGKRNGAGYNAKKWLLEKPNGDTIIVTRSYQFSRSLGKRWSNLYIGQQKHPGRANVRGEWAGWKIIKEIKEQSLID